MVGRLGAWLTPEFTRSTSLLARLHAAHTSLLPLALTGLIALHFWLIRYWGIRADGPRTVPFPRVLGRLTGAALLGWAAIGALAMIFPPGLGHPAIGGAEVTKPFWPFLWIYAAENAMGLPGMLVAPAVLFAFLAAVPLVDRGERRRGWVAIAGGVVLLALLAAIVYGALAPRQAHLM
jgi:ubiquinol-cytochrome c reductase cytochrome b subunit